MSEGRAISRSRRSSLIAAAAVGAVVGGAIVGVVVWLGRSGGGHHAARIAANARTTTTTTDNLPSDPTARQLVQLLRQAETQVFHARYEVRSGNQSAVLELWHRPPMARRDTTERKPGVEDQVSEIATADAVFSCTRTNSVPWTCIKSERDPTHDPSDVSFGTLSKFVATTTFTVSDTTMLGRPARCFAGKSAPSSGAAIGAAGTSAPPSPVRMCTTLQGIPLLIDTGDGPVSAVALDTDLPAGVFTPPAKPIGG